MCTFVELRHGHAICKARNGNATPTYRSWQSMLDRCRNPKNPAFRYYGGKGIAVCKRWLDFRLFLKDMGERPRNTTLDRKNNNKNYSPKNCRWATTFQQNENRAGIRLFSFKGKTQTLSAWARDLNVSKQVLYRRFYRGWTVKEILGRPVGRYRNV